MELPNALYLGPSAASLAHSSRVRPLGLPRAWYFIQSAASFSGFTPRPNGTFVHPSGNPCNLSHSLGGEATHV